MNTNLQNQPAMNDPYAAFSQTSQPNPGMSAPLGAGDQSANPSAAQISATDRLEELLRQLQEEQVSVPSSQPMPASQSESTSSQDFISALSRVPEPPSGSKPDSFAPTALGGLDEVIKTIGEQFEMGQPSLSELLQLAKNSAKSANQATTESPSPMQFARPHSGVQQRVAVPIASAIPKVTVMPSVNDVAQPMLDPAVPALNLTPVAPVAPNRAAAPETMNTAEVPSALRPTPAPTTAPITPAEAPAATPRRRVLSQYLQNLANHLKQHGQLNLPSYSKLVVAR